MDSNIANPHDVYEKAENYWSRCSQDISGMLGGEEKLHVPDIARSKTFIEQLKQTKVPMKFDTCLDCGAGIGRVTRDLLTQYYKTVDMVDMIDELIAKTYEFISTDDGIGERYVEGLQTFDPEKKKYDMIWIQWVSGHLTDDDLRRFLERCVIGLAAGGTIVIKDNILRTGDSFYDDSDSSWTRSETRLLGIARDAGLLLVKSALQTGFPRGTQTVKMFAFRPWRVQE